MRRLAHKLSLLALALCASVSLAACGKSHTKVTSGTYAGESGANAPYLDVGPLTYEVQLSRQLNPNSEDAQYLEGLTEAQRKLAPGQEWFAVFLQVYNHSSDTHLAATKLTISDTQSNVYEQVVPSQSNPFAYKGGSLEPGGRIPELNTIAANGPTQGALVLFKINVISLDNRPLRLKIVDPSDVTRTASAELDV